MQERTEQRPGRNYRLVDRLNGPHRLDGPAERATLLQGLFSDPAAIAPKYLYDAMGCALFNAICLLPEYYPPRAERAIFVEHRDSIVDAVGRGGQFVDLGAGDCAKAAYWFSALRPRRYIAVDIATAAMEPALARLATEFPHIEFSGVITDFSRSLQLAQDLDDDRVTFFYPGSSIGNFSPNDAVELLATIHKLCARGGGLLIGVDLEKDPARLHAAYDDALGVTAAFNRNILNHVNALIGSDFDPAAFTHVARYDIQKHRIEMHLESSLVQHVHIGNRTREFEKGERIHTENSYKYSPASFEALLRRAGFSQIRLWQDALRGFAVFYAA